MSSYPGVLQTIRAPIRHYRSARLSRVRTPASYQKYPSEPVAAVLTPFDEVYDDKTLWIAKLPPKAARSSSPDLPWSGLKYAKHGNNYARNKSALADNIQTLVFHLTSKPRSRGEGATNVSTGRLSDQRRSYYQQRQDLHSGISVTEAASVNMYCLWAS